MQYYISIHALREESDVQTIQEGHNPNLFLSTLSVRRATARACPGQWKASYFYPRSP